MRAPYCQIMCVHVHFAGAIFMEISFNSRKEYHSKITRYTVFPGLFLGGGGHMVHVKKPLRTDVSRWRLTSPPAIIMLYMAGGSGETASRQQYDKFLLMCGRCTK